MDRVATRTDPLTRQESYAYDANGNLADVADRLTSVTQGTATVGFTYDTANRRTGLTLPNGVTAAYAYDAASKVTGITYACWSTGPPAGEDPRERPRPMVIIYQHEGYTDHC
jgi:YD repeat-containing protein